MNIDRPHPKDGEGNVFTGVRLSVGSGGGQGGTPVSGPRSLLGVVVVVVPKTGVPAQ